MNVIACLNLLIAGLMAAYTAFKVAVLWSHLAASFCGLSPDLCHQADADALKAQLDAADPNVQRWLDQSLRDLAQLERVTSSATPTIAQTQVSKAQPGTLVAYRFGFGASSISDSGMSGFLPALAGSPRMNAGGDQPSLPIEEVNGIAICHDLEPWTRDMVFQIIDGLHAPWFRPFIDANSTFLNLDSDTRDTINDVACTRPYIIAGVWAGAKQRPEVTLQVYGFGFGEPNLLANNSTNVRLMVGGKEDATPPKNYTVSQAEYFPDCSGSPWATCSSLPLFAPNWSARLRRVRASQEIKSASGALSLAAQSSGTTPPAFVTQILSDPGALWARVDELIH